MQAGGMKSMKCNAKRPQVQGRAAALATPAMQQGQRSMQRDVQRR
jgi:homoserine acetyltransferase